MPVKMSPALYTSIKNDIEQVAIAFKVELHDLSFHGIQQLLNVVSTNRAYDDTHPTFSSGSGTLKRSLPYDGRDYCFFYKDGQNNLTDDHLTTALRHMLKGWKEAAKAKSSSPLINTLVASGVIKPLNPPYAEFSLPPRKVVTTAVRKVPICFVAAPLT